MRARLREILLAGAEAGGATVVGEEFHVFPNGAVTGVLVLAQSHLSIHTWPEFALANVDLLSYGHVRADEVLRVDLRGARRRARVRQLDCPSRLAERDRIVREVAAAVGLAEGERGVRAVLAAVARLEPVSTRRLSRTVDLPVPIVASVCGELRKRARRGGGAAHAAHAARPRAVRRRRRSPSERSPARRAGRGLVVRASDRRARGR